MGGLIGFVIPIPVVGAGIGAAIGGALGAGGGGIAGGAGGFTGQRVWDWINKL